MSEVLEYAARLSRVIGARPGGTEEEQQASFIIEETLKGHGLETSIEEFNCNPNYELPRIVCCVVSIVLALLAMFLPLVLVPAIIISAITAVLYIMEVVGVSPLNNIAKRGISQNVIAKYIPGELEIASEDTGSIEAVDVIDINATEEEIEAAEAEAANGEDGSRKRSRSRGRSKSERGRKRKIIVLARYDSGKVCRELNQPFFKFLTPIRWAEMIGIAAIPIIILLCTVTNAEGGLLAFWNVLIVIGIVLAFLPVLTYIMHQTAQFTDGANNNASGVAVMMEVGRRLANGAREAYELGSMEGESAPSELGTGESGVLAPPRMHGEEAVRESGMLPVDTDLVYHEVAEGADPRAKVPEEAASAEALVAEGVVPTAKPEGLVGVAVAGNADMSAAEAAAVEAAAADASSQASAADVRMPSAPEPGASIPQAPPVPAPPEMDPNLPDWFRKGLKAAKANMEESGEANEPANIQRSRFADALDAAHEVSANSIQEFEARESGKAAANEHKNLTESGIDADRLQQLRDSIVESNVAAKAEVAAVAAEIAASEAEAAKQAAEKAQAKEAERAERVANAKGKSTDELTPEEAVSQAGNTLQADVAAAIGEKQAEKAAAQAQAAEEVAEQAAVADRTIAYIPVAAEIPAEISASDISDVSVVDTVGKSAADILEEASAKATEDEATAPKESHRKKRSISLPSLTGAIEGANVKHQDAPLADDAERNTSEREALKATGRRIRDSLTSLPSTDLPPKEARIAKPVKAQESISETVVASREGSTTSFLKDESADAKAALSSLDAPAASAASATPSTPAKSAKSAASATPAAAVVSASAPSQATSEDVEAAKVSSAGSFVAPSSTSQFQPVGDELIENAAAEDIIIHDADDSDYAENITHTGAMAGPGYVEMPKSRASRIKNIFSRKKKRESDSISFSEAVGIDDGFDARQVGAARGGWESFQNESAAYDAGSGRSVISGESSEATYTAAKGRRSHVDEYSTNSRQLRKSEDEHWGGNAWDDDDWNGGAFSSLRDRIAGAAGGAGGSGADGEGDEEVSDDARGTRAGRSGRSARSARDAREAREGRSSRDGSGSRRSSRAGGSSTRSSRRRSADDVATDEGRPIGAEDMLEEREQIRSFRTSSAPLASFDEVAAYASTFSKNLDNAAGDAADESASQLERPHGFGTEVWFVALGAELADNAGIKDFISKHSDDMRGAVFVDIDAMGAGTLSLIDEEGVIRRVKASSRMKRYVTKAGTSLGLHINSVKMTWRESAAYFTNRKGLQTIHVAGMQDGKPAYLGEIDDKFENLDEEKLLENTAFVLELLNTI